MLNYNIEILENQVTDLPKKNKNTFNLIDSKEWLPFQKSWTIADDAEKVYRDNVRFFTLPTLEVKDVAYDGNQAEVFSSIVSAEKITVTQDQSTSIQFALFDWINEIKGITQLSELDGFLRRAQNAIDMASQNLIDGRFLAIFAQNKWIEDRYVPIAWELAKMASRVLSLRDEKIMCFKNQLDSHPNSPIAGVAYALYLRRDAEPTSLQDGEWDVASFTSLPEQPVITNELPSWFILKPQRRSADEVLHPAKYPEELVTMFVSQFSKENDNIFDPMSGTGSTQMGALSIGRNAYGTELSTFFWEIANNRLLELVNPTQMSLFEDAAISNEFRIECGDARRFAEFSFPRIQYLLTSPPYWDMLNMKGAETQAKRQELGLRTNYSESEMDLGNQGDYSKFLDDLVDIYSTIFQQMGSGALATIVVKNIKKKGVSYPFAWDLSHRLTGVATLISEHFWLQDDISIFPFAFGRTWVSNTFHQYCLTYRIL
jgi:hypothetical protein